MTAGTRRGLLPWVAALALALCAAVPVAANAAAPPPPGFFGMVPSAPSQTEANQMAASGVATVRVQVNWGFIEPRQGQRDWTVYDNYVGYLAVAGLRVEPVLFGVPSWISSRTAAPPIYTAAQRQAWMGFVADLAARYGPNGSFWKQYPTLPYEPFAQWEVWNEPNLSGYWGGRPSPRRFVRLLRVTRAALDRSDPSAQIAIGGLFPPPRARYGVSLESFLGRLYKVHGARRLFDAVAIHPYASRPGGVLAACREARRLMVRNHDRRAALWITELGWSTGGTHWGQSPFKATEAQQAKFLRASFAGLIRARKRLNLQLLIWHAWQDSTVAGLPWTFNMGLIRSDGSAKPSLAAYSSFAK
jgi:polysaccharide biosynthesis protein PslG